MKTIFIALSCATLAACCPPATIIREPVEVQIPVPVPCLTELPSCPVTKLDEKDLRGETIYVKGSAVIMENEQNRQCIVELRAAMVNCVQPVK